LPILIVPSLYDLFLAVTVKHVFRNGCCASSLETMVLANEYFGEACPASAPFFGFMGAAAALIFASEYARWIVGGKLPCGCLNFSKDTNVSQIRT
jgi:hypothetical protein